MSGLQLSSMEASDMTDVVHYIMEKDFNVSTAEQQEAKSDMRSIIYRDLYATSYKYAVKKNKNSYTAADGEFFEEGNIEPFDPLKAGQEVKSYVPPTDFNPDFVKPFGSKIDEPLN